MPYLFRFAGINICYNDLGSMLSKQLGCRSSHTLTRSGNDCNLQRKLEYRITVVGVTVAFDAYGMSQTAAWLHLAL